MQYLMNLRKKKVILEFRDFLFSLSTSFSSGRHMVDGLKEAKEYLYEIHGDNSLLYQEVQYMIKAIDETGATDLSVLESFSERLRQEDVYLFTDTFRACRETGGNMAEAIHKAAFFISEKINMEMEIRTMVSQKKLEGRIIAMIPFLMIIFLRCTSPAYLDVMYSTFAGRCLMSTALIMTVFAYIWMERMTNVEL